MVNEVFIDEILIECDSIDDIPQQENDLADGLGTLLSLRILDDDLIDTDVIVLKDVSLFK